MGISSVKLFKVLTTMEDRKFDAAIALLDKLIKKDTKQAKLYNLKATCLLKIGRNEEALELCEQIIAHMESSAMDWNNKGLALQGLERRNEAKDAFEHALSLEKDHFFAIYNLGNLFFDTDPAQAREWYEKALSIKPNHPLTLLNLGYLCAEACEYSRAEECYTKALEHQEKYAAAAFYRGDLAERLGDIETAVKWYEQTLEWDSDFKEADERLSKIMVPLDEKE